MKGSRSSNRSGQFIPQRGGYNAFVPNPFQTSS